MPHWFTTRLPLERWKAVATEVDAAWAASLEGAARSDIAATVARCEAELPADWWTVMEVLGRSGVTVLGDCVMDLSAVSNTRVPDYQSVLDPQCVVIAEGGLSPWALSWNLRTGEVKDLDSRLRCAAGLDHLMWRLLAERARNAVGGVVGAWQAALSRAEADALLARGLEEYEPGWIDALPWEQSWCVEEGEWVHCDLRGPFTVTVFSARGSVRGITAVERVVGVREWRRREAEAYRRPARGDRVP